MHRFVVWFILTSQLCSFVVPASAQQDYEQWAKKQQDLLQQFKDKRDKAFTDFLQKDWKEFQAFQGLVRDDHPKPKNVPTAKVSDVPPPPATVPKVTTVPPPQPVPEKPTSPEPPILTGNLLKLNFFNTPVEITYSPNLQVDFGSEINNETITAYWADLSKSDYEPMVKQITKISASLGLNDWGKVLLVHTIAGQLNNGNTNTATLWTWFILTKCGYNTRIGFSGNAIYLMMASGEAIYGAPYLTVDDQRYFIVPFDGKPQTIQSLTSYQGAYPGQQKTVGFRISASPAFADEFVTKTIRFSYLGSSYTVPVQVNRNLIRFYRDYPQTEIPVYFERTINPTTANSILEALGKIIKGKSETEAVNIILSFVQTGFRYETDEKQFGSENYLFPEETLFYPASDCEDRAALFAFLVRNLLDLPVVGLDYPGHIATAVLFSTPVGRDGISYQGKTYTICDPTYIHAEYGMTMPIVKGKHVKVFALN